MAGSLSFVPVLVLDGELNQIVRRGAGRRGRRGRFGEQFSGIEAKRSDRGDGDKEFCFCHGDGLPGRG